MPNPEGTPADHARAALRLLTAADVPFAHALNAAVNWNQTAADWRGYLSFEPEGCFVAEISHRPAGTATTIRYGDRFGWIGMVIVDPEFRRFGVGTQLLRHAIAYLRQRGTGCIKLDATPMGRRVYVPLGFVDEYELSRYEGTAPADVGPPGAGVAPYTAADAAAVEAFDAPLFGAPRGAVLRSLASRQPAWCWVARDGGEVCGYLIAREGRQAVQLGPWAAADGATAEGLLRALLHRMGGRRMFVDVPHPNAAGRALVERYGFGVQRGFVRMHLGENRAPGRPECIYGSSGAEKG